MLNAQYEKDPYCKLHESDLELLSPLTDCVSKYIDEEKPSKLQQRILRSLQWIGSSIQDDIPEDKISKLCTALETLLIPENEGRKGEKLAYRIALLQSRINSRFSWPERAFLLYEKRSEIVHGSDYDKEPPNKQDVKSLEFLTRQVFELVCKLTNTEGFTKITQLISWLEADDDNKQGLDKWIKENCSEEFVKSLFPT